MKKQLNILSREAKASMPKLPPPSGYNLFMQEKCHEIKQNNPASTFKEMTKMVQQLWKETSEEDKMSYQRRSYQMKHRYNQEYQKWLDSYQIPQPVIKFEDKSKTEVKSIKSEITKILEIVERQETQMQEMKTSIEELKLQLTVTNMKMDLKIKDIKPSPAATPVIKTAKKSAPSYF